MNMPSTATILPDLPPAAAAPAIPRTVQRALVAIEGDAYSASTELVDQRDDLAAAAIHDAEHDAALERALSVDGLPAFARELIRMAMAADEAEDAAITQAGERRDRAHGHTRAIAGRVERTLTGRCRP